MKEIILLKDGELALKGLNRSSFEDMLIKNIKERISSLGEFTYRKAQSTIVVSPKTRILTSMRLFQESARSSESLVCQEPLSAKRISMLYGRLHTNISGMT